MIHHCTTTRKLFAVMLLAPLLISSPAIADEEVWSLLKQGGMVVLMRHTSVEQGKDKGNSLLRDASCAKERNLSMQGKSEALQIGQSFKDHEVPIGQVLASPYCRTMESAKLAFGKVVADESLTLIEGLPPEARERNSAATAITIGSYKGGANLIMVSHQPNIEALTFEMIEKGEFLVLKPQGNEKFEVVGKIALPSH